MSRLHKLKPENTAQTEANSNIKYAVYVHYPSNQKKQSWERASHTEDENLALEQARMLFDSGKFKSVEIKKLSEGRASKGQRPYKIFKTAEKIPTGPALITCGLTAALFSFAAYIILA